MKRLLALSWCMPPLVMPRSIQVSRLLAALADLGWETDIVCVDPASLRSDTLLDDSLERPAGGMVKKFPVPSMEDWITVRGLIRVFPSLGALPDPKWIWKQPALRQCRILAEENDYDAFISFGQPWTDHLAGLDFKKQNQLPWVAHFSDPWADNPFVKASSWVLNKQFEMEQDVINSADAVVFVSNQTADFVMSKYPADRRTKVRVIPHGFESLPQEVCHAKRLHERTVEFLYTGNFYGRRTPENLFRAASKLNQKPGYENSFMLRFAGQNMEQFIHSAHDLGLENLTVFEGPVSFARSQSLAIQSDILLVIDAPSETNSVFLPSKLVDYLAFGKPILGITPLNGTSADLITRLGYPVVDPLDVDGIAKNLQEMIENHSNDAIPHSPQFAGTIDRYRIENVAKEMDSLLRSLIK